MKSQIRLPSFLPIDFFKIFCYNIINGKQIYCVFSVLEAYFLKTVIFLQEKGKQMNQNEDRNLLPVAGATIALMTLVVVEYILAAIGAGYLMFIDGMVNSITTGVIIWLVVTIVIYVICFFIFVHYDSMEI